jgi:hypothetical protein
MPTRRPSVQQMLDDALHGERLAAPGLAEDGDVLLERCFRYFHCGDLLVPLHVVEFFQRRDALQPTDKEVVRVMAGSAEARSMIAAKPAGAATGVGNSYASNAKSASLVPVRL